jgi:DNA-binding response OmpR family regulator
MKILIIEDDPIIANIYRSRLDKEGFQVEIAPDGQTGFYRIHEGHPDALLLDLMLPKMDGLQILRKIRAQKAFAKLPVIVFTNAYVPNMIHEANAAGANLVFNKAALTPREIVDAINGALFQNAANRQPAAPATEMETPAASPMAAADSDAVYNPISISNLELPAAAEKQSAAELDAVFEKDLRGSFVKSAPQTLAALRKLLHEFMRASTDQDRLSTLFEMYRKVHSIAGNAAIVGLDNIAQMCAAFEALLKELKEKPKNISPSCMRTIAHAVDFLGVLFERGTGPSLLSNSPIDILVVDDEIISRRAIIYALEKAHLKSEGIEDPLAALKLLGEKHYDLIILDVDMPEMNGFELCAKLRVLPMNQNSPVIFVTGLTDFESRARSSLCGGNDLIAKPFFFIELAVKALIFVIKGRLTQMQNQAGSETIS